MAKIYLIREPNDKLGIAGQTQEFDKIELKKVVALCQQLNKDNPQIVHYVKICSS